MNQIKRICVYCGSADDLHEDYLSAARNLGRVLAEQGITLVYGAGKTGLMGAVAEGALGAGGTVIGVIPENLNQPQLARLDLTEVEVCDNIAQRQARMQELSDAMIALPGGFGTMYELFEALTWSQIGLHNKPIGVLNVRGYFTPLMELLAHAREEGFIYPEHYDLLIESSSSEELLKKISAYTPPQGLERWVTRK
jgi:uncharacterized protein (TIGR00730 family)